MKKLSFALIPFAVCCMIAFANNQSTKNAITSNKPLPEEALQAYMWTELTGNVAFPRVSWRNNR